MIFKAKNGAQIIERLNISEKEAIQTLPNLNHALVIVKIDNDYLLGYHKWRDDWETFGGLIEEGESLRECIERTATLSGNNYMLDLNIPPHFLPYRHVKWPDCPHNRKVPDVGIRG